MTRDEVLSMARKVKLGAALDFDYRGSFGAMTAPEQDRLVQLEQFAALVAAREREACALRFQIEVATWTQLGHLKGSVKRKGTDAIRARATTPKETE